MSLQSPQLEAFAAVAECKSVHGAAQILHITQTAVTQRLRLLEQKLQSTLFIRSRRGMLLTPEGEALLRYYNAVRELEGSAMAKITGAAIESYIRISITGPTSIMRSRIIPQCLPVMKRFNKLLMTFATNDREDRIQDLRNGQAHLAIISEASLAREMEHKYLKREEYVLVATHLWKHRDIRDIIQNELIIDYEPTDEMTFHYLETHGLFELARHERHFANRTESLALLTVAGVGYSLLTREFSQPYLARGELIVLNEGHIFNYQPVLAWYARPEPPAYFSALIAAIN